jgi:hypothetical protein
MQGRGKMNVFGQLKLSKNDTEEGLFKEIMLDKNGFLN